MLHDYTENMKTRLAFFRLKGNVYILLDDLKDILGKES